LLQSFDEGYMRMALELAQLGRGQTHPNPMVGAVIVKDGRIVGQGAHLYAGGPHAEVYALAMAGAEAENATVYVTLEPCSHYGKTPPCADALVRAGVGRVVVAIQDVNPQVGGRGIRRLREAGVQVDVGVCEDEARALNEGFFFLMKHQRPLVLWKCAATLDGYIATATGHSRYVTGVESRQRVQRLRQEVGAIAVGVGTVLADNPQLTVRLGAADDGAAAHDGAAADDRAAADDGATAADHHRAARGQSQRWQPLRVIFDSRLSTPASARLLTEPGKTLIYTTHRATAAMAPTGQTGVGAAATDAGAAAGTVADAGAVSDKIRQMERRNPEKVEIVALAPGADGRVPLATALADLGMRGIHTLLVEGGKTLVSALMKERLVDQLMYFIAPKLLGGGISALDGLGMERMSQALQVTNVHWQGHGEDLCLRGDVAYPED